MYKPPYSKNEVIEKYGMNEYQKLSEDPVQNFRMNSGIELVHDAHSKRDIYNIYHNWLVMDDEKKKISDEKSVELFGIDNMNHFLKLIAKYRF